MRECTLARASKEVMHDAIDLPALHRCFAAAGLPTYGGQLTAAGRGALVTLKPSTLNPKP
jgi:hypothetical protein